MLARIRCDGCGLAEEVDVSAEHVMAEKARLEARGWKRVLERRLLPSPGHPAVLYACSATCEVAVEMIERRRAGLPTGEGYRRRRSTAE